MSCKYQTTTFAVFSTLDDDDDFDNESKKNYFYTEKNNKYWEL